MLQPSPHTPSQKEQPRDGIDRRRYERSFVPVAGRLLLPSGAEHTCQVVDISEGGIALTCPVETEFGDKIIVYLDDLGRFEGQIVRFIPNGFAIETQLVANQRQRLVDRITWLKQKKTGAERRIFPRRIPAQTELSDNTSMTVEAGTKIQCTILDMSVTGAHVQTSKRPRLGTHVTVGRMVGRVMRHTLEGIGIEFVTAG
ncbi:PilZ domain-containing protein [Parvibaculum lavamentivorans]|nr:PilZ domain-containing protein [Parvibaculum lavamentivorans]